MPPQTGARATSLVDPSGRPLMITGQLLPAEVSDADFSPGQPITPIRQEPIRTWDFPIGVNTQITTRAYEPFGFNQLRAFANVELVRMAIETRKDQIERLQWQIKPKGDAGRKKKGNADPRIENIAAFWSKPGVAGGKPASFSKWLRVAMEDLLAIDAPAFEKRRNRGGDLIGLDIVPGDTIKVLVDDTGRLPVPPYPAYEQIIKGRVWNALDTTELLYAPRNQRPNHLYGFGPVEQIVVTIHTIINRQAGQLAYFTEGNTPRGFLNAPDGATPQQIKELQTWLDAALSGNMGEKAKTILAPFGAKLQSLKNPPLKDDFDEWLARIVAYAFSLPPTPFIKQMNRSTGQTDQDRAMEEGLEPLKLWVKRLVDEVNEEEFGVTDLEFAWQDTPEIDPDKQSQIDDRNLKNGSATWDEVRDARGDDPYPNGVGAKPVLISSTGAQTLEQVMKAADDAVNEVEPPAPLPNNQPPPPGQTEPGHAAQQPPGDGSGTGARAPPSKAEKLAKAAPIAADRPKARRHAIALRKSIAPALAAAGDEVAAEVGMQLRGMHKAADDAGMLTNSQLAAQIAQAVTLAKLEMLSEDAYDDLFEVAQDSAGLAIASVGADPGGFVDQVHDRAVAWARQRAADLVSLDGPDNIVGPTRDMIRAVIADGLEQNLGAQKIADLVQASTAFSTDRAELIANTEIAGANGQGKLEGWKAAEDTGLTLQKSWVTFGACCDDCADNEAAGPIDLDEDFPSGDDAEPAHPGCKCACVAEVAPADDADTE